MSFLPYPLICHTPISANKLIFAIIEEYYSLLISIISLTLLILPTLPISLTLIISPTLPISLTLIISPILLISLILIILLFPSVIYFERASVPALCLEEQASKEV